VCWCYAVLISVDEVLRDPTGSLRPGERMVLLSDEVGAIVRYRDTLEIRGDFYPPEYPHIFAWKPYHAILVTGTRNRGPTLTDPSAVPLEIIAGTRFTFSVRYGDLDGDSLDLFLVLDGTRIKADNLSGENDSNGSFSISVNLSPGIHNYSFVADDGIGAPNSTTSTGTQSLTVIPCFAVYLGIGAPGLALAIVAFVRWRRRKRSQTARAGDQDGRMP